MQIGAMVKAEAAGSGPVAAPEPRLVRAAHEFEGQMMKELLQPLLAGGGVAGEDDASGANATLGELGAESLGQALSRQGGLGIADRIVHQLSQSGKQNHPGKVTANLRADTVMRGGE
jgi:Rod binding domain-containing protein